MSRRSARPRFAKYILNQKARAKRKRQSILRAQLKEAGQRPCPHFRAIFYPYAVRQDFEKVNDLMVELGKAGVPANQIYLPTREEAYATTDPTDLLRARARRYFDEEDTQSEGESRLAHPEGPGPLAVDMA